MIIRKGSYISMALVRNKKNRAIIKRRNRLFWKSLSKYKLVQSIVFTLEKILNYPHLRKNFKEKLDYSLDLRNPKSFNQKVIWKKVYDRNPLLPVVADKYKVRNYLSEILGPDRAEHILIQVLYITSNPETIPFEQLPKEYVIKACHGSGYNILIQNNDEINEGKIIAKCKEWLNMSYGLFKFEWAYWQIERKIIIEKLLRDSRGNLPKDYKFNMFNGKCKLIQVDHNRFADHRTTFYDENWNPLPVKKKREKGPIEPKPQELPEMIELAELLSQPFDYIRVDLYLCDGQIYFGELTNYPASGMGRFEPYSYDLELGSYWKLKYRYWEK